MNENVYFINDDNCREDNSFLDGMCNGSALLLYYCFNSRVKEELVKLLHCSGVIFVVPFFVSYSGPYNFLCMSFHSF